ncbi:MAG: hypothetical protein JRI23_27730 [Deltaproteobacteria bacterium]|nr:hypothetical protein [Deltaproteobacteria bacterium]MBW2535875.1 hypothetical protein [Deltaproteobacteria bacterium]
MIERSGIRCGGRPVLTARRAIAAAIMVVSGAAASGCEDVGVQLQACKRPATDAPLAYQGGNVEEGVYMTAPWDGELLNFHGGAYYRIYHQLPSTPRWFQFYLSFERSGAGGGALSLAPPAGNQLEVKAVDDESIVVMNATCTDYWLLAVAGGASAAGGAGGAGGFGGGVGGGP